MKRIIAICIVLIIISAGNCVAIEDCNRCCVKLKIHELTEDILWAEGSRASVSIEGFDMTITPGTFYRQLNELNVPEISTSKGDKIRYYSKTGDKWHVHITDSFTPMFGLNNKTEWYGAIYLVIAVGFDPYVGIVAMEQDDYYKHNFTNDLPDAIKVNGKLLASFRQNIKEGEVDVNNTSPIYLLPNRSDTPNHSDLPPR